MTVGVSSQLLHPQESAWFASIARPDAWWRPSATWASPSRRARTGKRVFEGEPTDDPQAAVIWEAFKPDTEPPRVTRQDRIADLREELLSLIRRGTDGSLSSNDGQPSDFVEEQGGIY